MGVRRAFPPRLQRGRVWRNSTTPTTRACVEKFHPAHNAGVVKLADT